MKNRRHSLTLIGDPTSRLHSSFTKDQKKKLWDSQGFGKTGQSFSWDQEDYRQSSVNSDISDAIPKEEDFIAFPFRHLSATTVGGGSWKATEFPENVLKKGHKMLSYKPVYVNHNMEISNNVGVNGKMSWTPAFVNSDGIKVPAGIDGPIWIDGKLHTDLCRKLNQYPVPAIQSVSVTVIFEWKPSHEFTDETGEEDIWLFERRIGTMIDGTMVRRIATKIIEFYETSFVWLGADPFAKIKGENGDLLNIEESSIVGLEKFDKDPLNQLYKDSARYFVRDNCNCEYDRVDLINAFNKNNVGFGKAESQSDNNNKPKKEKSMELLLKKLASMLNVKQEELSENSLDSLVLLPQDDHNLLTELSKKVGTLESYDKMWNEHTQLKAGETKLVSDLANANSTIEANKALVVLAESKISAAKELALKHYRLTLKGKPEESKVISMIEKSESEKDLEALETFVTQFGGKALVELGASCSACGSEDVSFRTSIPEGGEETDDFVIPSLSDKHRM